MKLIVQILALILMFFLFVGFMSLLLGLPVMWLWNWLMTDLFKLRPISFFEAVGLILLCGILFKSHTSSK